MYTIDELLHAVGGAAAPGFDAQGCSPLLGLQSVHAPWYAAQLPHLPRSRLEQYRGSPTLDLALASGALVAGNASDFVAHARAHRKTVSRRRDLHFAGEVGARFLEAS